MEQAQVRKMRPAPRGRLRLSYLRLHEAPGLSDLGRRDTSFHCSDCDTMLFERVDESIVRGLKVKCPNCAAISIA